MVDHRGRADRPLLVMRPAALREAVPPADHRRSAYSNRVAISALDRFRNNTIREIRARCTGPGGMLDAECRIPLRRLVLWRGVQRRAVIGMSCLNGSSSWSPFRPATSWRDTGRVELGLSPERVEPG
jgi:hypothetical protein